MTDCNIFSSSCVLLVSLFLLVFLYCWCCRRYLFFLCNPLLLMIQPLFASLRDCLEPSAECILVLQLNCLSKVVRERKQRRTEIREEEVWGNKTSATHTVSQRRCNKRFQTSQYQRYLQKRRISHSKRCLFSTALNAWLTQWPFFTEFSVLDFQFFHLQFCSFTSFFILLFIILVDFAVERPSRSLFFNPLPLGCIYFDVATFL